MKTLALILTLLLAAPLSAAPHRDHADGAPAEWAALFGDAPLPVVWRSIIASRENIETAFAAGKLDGVPAWAETIHLAAHALADQIKLPDADAHRRLAAALTQAAQVAAAVLDAAQHDETRRAATSFTRLKSALTVTHGRLPADLVAAAFIADPRFATAPAHDDHHH